MLIDQQRILQLVYNNILPHLETKLSSSPPKQKAILVTRATGSQGKGTCIALGKDNASHQLQWRVKNGIL